MKKVKNNPRLSYSRPEITLKRWANFNPRFHQVVGKLGAEVVEAQERRPQRDTIAKLQLSVGLLVRDSIAIVLGRRRLSAARLHKSAGWYSSPANREGPSYRVHIEMAYNALLRLGYLEETEKGFYSRGAQQDAKKNRITRFVATDKLLDLFTEAERAVLPVIVPPPEVQLIRVQAKDADGRKISIPVLNPPQSMLDNTSLINGVLQRSWYDLNMSDDEVAALLHELWEREGEERHLDLSRRTLYRVFNDDNFETGGRFYGAWWQNVPRRVRGKIILNGKPTVEYDYSNMHPTILYSREGLAPPRDSYSAVVERLEIYRLSETAACRSMIKQAFNAMLNSKGPLSQAPRDLSPKPSEFGLKWKQVAEAIREFHAPIAHHFETGVGLRLQRLDSDIAEAVMLYYAKLGVPVLPLHDSFIMHSGYETGLQDVMRNAFEAVVGVAPRVDKVVFARQTEADMAEELWDEDDTFDEEGEAGKPWNFTTTDIFEVLANEPGHQKRLDQFYRLRALRSKNLR